ncbi:TRAP transporter small permease subunit [Bacillus hwajinpoensis]|uniref:TRAP transporter small permease subunit n=1 Tax=Guptibacillus hwajinpoensis TaxID=208199 RepID=A0A845EPG9_9BACL|nr:TRAP transporter small permease [Pseudalkalibacillus hwajinpoensis]MYL62321.1 TRAP transporter small permease subunit [Pseudalkalibacillus hwajinpoensis]
MNKSAAVGDRIESILGKVILILMLVLVTLVFMQVVLRYVFSSGMVWVEELERFIFVWLMFLGITMGIYKQRHIAITFVVEKIEKYFKGVNLVIHIITGAFFCVLTWQGTLFVIENFSGTASVLPIGIGYIYSIIPLSGIFAIIFIILINVRGKENL